MTTTKHINLPSQHTTFHKLKTRGKREALSGRAGIRWINLYTRTHIFISDLTPRTIIPTLREVRKCDLSCNDARRVPDGWTKGGKGFGQKFTVIYTVELTNE